MEKVAAFFLVVLVVQDLFGWRLQLGVKFDFFAVISDYLVELRVCVVACSSVS